MITNFTPQIGPDSTPKTILNLILLTAIISILSALLDPYLAVQEWLSLSWNGFNHLYYWQFVTYLFVESSYGGINFWFIISLIFNIYLLWMMGSMTIEYIGYRRFVPFYLLSGIFAGIISIFAMSITGFYSVLAGPTPAIYALIVVWTMLYPELEIFFFMLINIKAKWLTTGLLAIVLLMSFSQHDPIFFSSIFSGVIFGYLYSVISLELNSPFLFTHKFENFLMKLTSYIKFPTFKAQNFKDKIIDIKTGKPIKIDDDDEFMDAMLAKISKQGEKSLTPSERQRMDTISHKK